MVDLLTNLGVNWAKLIAQLINFGIVMLVLWKFAYKPVLEMLENRRKKIADSMTDADRIKHQLAKTETEKDRILDEARVQANRFIEEAREAAAKVREQETQKAVASAEQIITKAREASQADHDQMLTELKREVGRLVVETTAKVAGKVMTSDDQ